jgi:chemotaxis protein histidine kinase CheA
MADFFEFATDDDAYAGGGFNEALDELMEEAAPEPEPEPEKKKPYPEVDEPAEPVKPEPKPEPKKPKDQAGYDFFLEQHAQLRRELDETKKALEAAKHQPAPEPTDEDWAQNPNEAARRVAEIERQKEAQQHEEQVMQWQQSVNNSTYERLAEKVPAFAKDPTVRARWANMFYSNPKYQHTPDGSGVLKAAQDMAKIFYADSQNDTPQMPSAEAKSEDPKPEAQAPPDQAQEQQQTPNDPPANPRTPPASDARRAAVKKGAMHGGGKGGNKGNVKQIDPTTRKFQRLFGVSDEAVRKVM